MAHRAHLSRVHRIWTANIHEVPYYACRKGSKPDNCSIINVNALDSWMFHFSGEPVLSNDTARGFQIPHIDHVKDNLQFQIAMAEYRTIHNLTVQY